MTQRKDGVKRSYQIEIATMSDDKAARTPPMLFVKFRYPSDDALRRKQEAAARTEEQKSGEATRRLASAEANGPRNYAISIQGQTAYEPVEVYDNGKITSFEFAGNIEMPAIYLAFEDGREELVPKSVSGNAVMVHAIGEKFVLRRGEDVMCVFNERFLPEGIDPGTKTTSPGVARVVKTAPVKTNLTVSSATPVPPGMQPLPKQADGATR